MEKLRMNESFELDKNALLVIKGGHPILVVLGAITTGVALGKAVDQASQWFLDGWNNPR